MQGDGRDGGYGPPHGRYDAPPQSRLRASAAEFVPAARRNIWEDAADTFAPAPILTPTATEEPAMRTRGLANGRPGQRARLGMKERVQRESLALCDEYAREEGKKLAHTFLRMRKALTCVREHILNVGQVVRYGALESPSAQFNALLDELQEFGGWGPETEALYAEILAVVESTLDWCKSMEPEPARPEYRPDRTILNQRQLVRMTAFDVLDDKPPKKRAGLKTRLHAGERQHKAEIRALAHEAASAHLVLVDGLIHKFRKINSQLRDYIVLSFLARKEMNEGADEYWDFINENDAFWPIIQRAKPQRHTPQRRWRRRH